MNKKVIPEAVKEELKKSNRVQIEKISNELHQYTLGLMVIAGTIVSFSIASFDSTLIKTKIFCTVSISLLLLLIIYLIFYAKGRESTYNKRVLLEKALADSNDTNSLAILQKMSRGKIDRSLDHTSLIISLALFFLFLSFIEFGFISDFSKHLYPPVTSSGSALQSSSNKPK